MNYLAFDYGKRFIGIAIGQSVTKTARPLTTIQNKNQNKKFGPDWASIQKLIIEWQPSALIIGIPLNMDGSEQWITQHARDFAKLLAEKFQLPIHEIDERLSTVEAKQALFDEGGYRSLGKEAIDAMAAKLILETWLNS